MIKIIAYFNERVKLFNIFDIKLIQTFMFFFALIIAKLFPQILDINIWWFVGLMILFIIRPLYVMFLKR